MTRPRTTPTDAANGDLRILLPDGMTLMHLSEAQARVLAGCSDNSPALVFAWNPAALTAFAEYLSAPGAAPAMPEFVPGPLAGPVSAATVRRLIIDYAAQIPAGTQVHMADAIVAPLTAQTCFSVFGKITLLGFAPAMLAYAAWPNAVLPLATVLVVTDGQRPVRAAATNGPHAAWGAPLFV
jgi:hypothetical protein